MNRRSFLRMLGGATAGLLVPRIGPAKSDKLGELLPLRILGVTGASVTMLGLGGHHIGEMSERDAQETIEHAIAGGVRFFDTAASYQGGGSESRLGKLLVPKYREDIFLMTKSTARTAAEARRHLDDSLRRLKTDRLDLWQMHSVQDADDVDRRVREGVIEVFREAQEKRRTRFIGFTGHLTPRGHLRVLETTKIFQTCQLPINVADPSYESFIRGVLPTLVERNTGVIAMKTLAGGHLVRERGQSAIVPGRISLAEAMHFVWSLPVSVLVSGPDTPGQFQKMIALARSFTAMDAKAREGLIAKVADRAGRSIEYYKS